MKLCVVGCERSGTSAISTLISISSGLSLLDDPPISWYIYPLVHLHGRGFPLKLLINIQRYNIIKIPGFATILTELKKIQFGKFKVIYVLRDPRDNVASILERLNQDYNGLFINVHWLGIKPKDEIEALAWRWRRYLELSMQFQLHYPSLIKYIRYEDFLVNKIETLKHIAHFCGINMNINKIINKLNIQYKKSWSTQIFGAGRYKKDLTNKQIQIINNICYEHMKQWGYMK